MGEGKLQRTWQFFKEGRSWFITVLMVSLMVLLALVLYASNYRPMQFLYTLF